MNPTCSSCAWFSSDGYRSYVHGTQSYQPGTCHLSPPTEKGFPRIRSIDYCGQHSSITTGAAHE